VPCRTIYVMRHSYSLDFGDFLIIGPLTSYDRLSHGYTDIRPLTSYDRLSHGYTDIRSAGRT
jgi:hypothetical protein